MSTTIWACGDCGFTTYAPGSYDYKCPECGRGLQAEMVPDGKTATDEITDD